MRQSMTDLQKLLIGMPVFFGILSAIPILAVGVNAFVFGDIYSRIDFPILLAMSFFGVGIIASLVLVDRIFRWAVEKKWKLCLLSLASISFLFTLPIIFDLAIYVLDSFGFLQGVTIDLSAQPNIQGL